MTHDRRTLLLVAAIATAALAALAVRAEEAPPTYEREVKPFFEKYLCLDCHNPEKMKKSKYDATTYAAALKNVKPGDVAGSKLIEMIEKGKMPPRKAAKKVAKEDLELLKRWIAAGAPEK